MASCFLIVLDFWARACSTLQTGWLWRGLSSSILALSSEELTAVTGYLRSTSDHSTDWMGFCLCCRMSVLSDSLSATVCSLGFAYMISVSKWIVIFGSNQLLKWVCCCILDESAGVCYLICGVVRLTLESLPLSEWFWLRFERAALEIARIHWLSLMMTIEVALDPLKSSPWHCN